MRVLLGLQPLTTTAYPLRVLPAKPNIKFKVNPAGGCPAASYFLLLRQNKVAKEKATPVCRRCAVPCVARLARRLRNSRYALRQSSPTPP